MFAPLRSSKLMEENGRVVGVCLSQGSQTLQARANWVILATGAVSVPLMAADMSTRRSPSAVAMRCYIKNEAMASEITQPKVIFHQSLALGYGWIFPCGKGLFNVGVGIPNVGGGFLGRRATKRSTVADTNLREMFDKLSGLSETASRLIRSGQQIGPLKGAPLRCTLEGAKLSRPGLLVTGEAAGSVYALTGEGIGKAMETGMLAADAVLLGPGLNEAQVREHYQNQIDMLRPRFKLYERAQLFNLHPWLAEIVIWRAQKSAKLRQRFGGILNEASNPGRLFTVRGLISLFTS